MAELQTRYRMRETEGSGGFGRVVRATDTWLEREIAIKILDPVMALEPDERLRFQQEARILAQLSHPNIPAIYDVIFNEPDIDHPGNGDPKFQIIFEHIEGTTLKQLIHDEGAIPLDDARIWFSQLASALGHAHSHGIVHRDVKPANIIIRLDRESCALVDFGIALTASQAERLTRTGYVVGTPGYMSPEQMSGEDVDARTDIFSLAVCLYEALAGAALTHGEYRSLTSLNESIPPAIDELIQECLDERSVRLAHSVDFAKRLADALRPRVSLASVLSEGRLSDLEAALRPMTPTEYADRPAGQRELIIAKVADLALSGDARFEVPVVNLLEQLISLGTRLEVSEYEETVDFGLLWAFEHVYTTGEIGKARLRRALGAVAPTLPAPLQRMVADKVLTFFEGRDLSTLQEYGLNGAREVVSNLLANRTCEDDLAKPLAKLRRDIDGEHRGRSTAPAAPSEPRPTASTRPKPRA